MPLPPAGFWPTLAPMSAIVFTASSPTKWMEALRVAGCSSLPLCTAGASRLVKWMCRQSPALTRSTRGRGRLSLRSFTWPAPSV